jgi:flagellin-like hook-associated protein FlgL
VSDGVGGAKLVNEIGEEITNFHSHTDNGYMDKISANIQGLVDALGGGDQQLAVVDSLLACSSKSATNGTLYSGSAASSYDAGYIASGTWATGSHDNFSIILPIPVSEIGKSFSITYYGTFLRAHLENQDSLEIQIGSNNKQSKTLNMINTTNEKLGLLGVSLETIENSKNAINTLTNAIELLMDKKVGMGTQERIFENIVDSISTLQVNSISSRSRIEGVDFALETAKLTSKKILHKAGISMVSQANSIPQRVLTLLKGI